MDKELISVGRWSVMLLDDIVDVLKYGSEWIKMGEIERWSRTVTEELTKRAKMKATTDIEKSRKKNKVGVYQECNENQPRG